MLYCCSTFQSQYKNEHNSYPKRSVKLAFSLQLSGTPTGFSLQLSGTPTGFSLQLSGTPTGFSLQLSGTPTSVDIWHSVKLALVCN
jgi:hypothetical protein